MTPHPKPLSPLAELEWKSIQYRRTMLTLVRRAKAGHIGGDLSCIDILNVLYNAVMDITPANFQSAARDHYIQSKGHAAEALFTVLADRGFYPPALLDSAGQYRSPFIGHPTRHVPGVEHNTGGLGHGLAVAAGLALALKTDGTPHRVFTLLGDGELEEGSNWEASMFAARYQLDNLTVIVDRNGLQITDRTEAVSQLEPLADKFRAFGYAVCVVDGNSLPALLETFAQLPFEPGKPNLVLAQTTKGKGISFIEDTLIWHHHVPSDEEYTLALEELALAEADWRRRYADR